MLYSALRCELDCADIWVLDWKGGTHIFICSVLSMGIYIFRILTSVGWYYLHSPLLSHMPTYLKAFAE